MPAIPARFLNPDPVTSLAPPWTSGNLAWTLGANLTVPHSLGRRPYLVAPSWICVEAETVGGIAHAVGDRVPGDFWTLSSVNYGILVRNVGSSNVIVIPYNPSNAQTLTSSRWRVVVDLW